MFDSVRRHQRLMLGFVLLLIFPAFVFFGISGYDKMIGGRDDVAVVAGTRISRNALEEAHRRQIEQMRSMLGDQVDVRLFDTPQARNQVLESLITQQALIADAADRHIAVAPDEVRKTVMSIAEFKGPDGRFSFDQYQAVLAQNQRTPRMFEAELAQELRMQAVANALQESAFEPRAVVDRVFVAQETRRTVRTRTIDPKAFEDGLQPTDAQLRAFYDERADQYQLPESVDIEYLVLERARIAPSGKPSDDELKAFYEQNKTLFTRTEARRASHILITVPAGADAAARAAARTRAEALLAEAREHPDRFAELAKANSQDPGSAEQGGDLGFFDREMMVKPFSDAAFATAPGEFAPLVESEFGFHVIRVTGVKEGGVTPFDEARERLVALWTEQQAARQYGEVAEQFRNTVYEQADTLEPAATKFGLTIQKASAVTRTPAPGASGPLANRRVLEQLFADESIKRGRNIEATEVGPGVLAAARVVKHHPARRQPFDEIGDTVRGQWILEEAARLARERGAALLAQLKAGDEQANAAELARFGGASTVTRAVAGELGPQAVSAAFALPAGALPAYAGVDIGRAGYQLIRVEKVEGPAADAEQRRERYARQYDRMAGQNAAGIWVQNVLNRIPIDRKRTN